MTSFCIVLALFAILLSQVHAFPHIAGEAASNKAGPQFKPERRSPGFDASAQLVDVTGAHAFVPPNFTAGDLRGPCPGLNALANHNYLPHNGFASVTQFVQATNQVFGMGLDLGGFLATYGLVMDGNPLSTSPGWSIGGPPTNTALLGSLTGLLGTPQGISGSHNKHEGDSSPTRGDLYQYGNDYTLQLPEFQALYDLQAHAAQPNYDLSVMLQHRMNRYQQSVSQNPYFYYGPFTGTQISAATYTFVYRFMSNKSAEAPEGILNQEVLKSFFGITGESGSFVYNPGYEQIPSNWYTRAVDDAYTIPFLETDILSFAQEFPQFLVPGGNTGTTNSFTPINITALTGGVYNAQTLTQGNNLQCFAYQALQQESPDMLKGLFSDITIPLGLLKTQITDVIGNLGCPQLQSIDNSQFSQYPGYSQSYDGHPANVGI